jgi:hypothetical protein
VFSDPILFGSKLLGRTRARSAVGSHRPTAWWMDPFAHVFVYR